MGGELGEIKQEKQEPSKMSFPKGRVSLFPVSVSSSPVSILEVLENGFDSERIRRLEDDISGILTDPGKVMRFGERIASVYNNEVTLVIGIGDHGQLLASFVAMALTKRRGVDVKADALKVIPPESGGKIGFSLIARKDGLNGEKAMLVCPIITRSFWNEVLNNAVNFLRENTKASLTGIGTIFATGEQQFNYITGSIQAYPCHTIVSATATSK